MSKIQKYTLDTNCLIALELGYTTAPGIRSLIKRHHEGTVRVQIAAIAASERQKCGTSLDNISEFNARLKAVGADAIDVLFPPCYAGISFSDCSIVVEGEPLKLEANIHEVLFPHIPFDVHLMDFELEPKLWGKWLNAKCDVLTVWCHIYYKGDVFVTSDDNFLKSKKKALIDLGAGEIKRPEDIL